MKKIFVVGGCGFAKECYRSINWCSEADGTIQFGGFLGHKGYVPDLGQLQHFFLGEVLEYDFKDDEYVVIGSGEPYLRKEIYEDLKSRGVNFYNLIPPGVRLNKNVCYGEANIFVVPFAPSVDVKIGNGNIFNCDVFVGHDVEIGDFNFFGPKSILLGYVKVGDLNSIGTNAVLLPKCKIGNENKIAPLSAVYKGCKDNCYMIGNPALKVN